jgi:hypothetical protein
MDFLVVLEEFSPLIKPNMETVIMKAIISKSMAN